MRRFPWLFLFLFLVGAGLGLYYSWVVSPVRYVNTTPDSLRADFKDHLRSAIAAAYTATGNLERARARLVLLHDSSMVEALNAQAQRMLAAGDSSGSVEQVAQLAVDLEAGVPNVQQASLTPTLEPTRPLLQDSPQPAAPSETPIPGQATEPPGTANSPTPRPTRTRTPRPGAPFELIAQDTLCDAGLQEGLLQVIVTDSRRRQLAGREIVAAWDGGEEHFFTGYKPELGNGYADFIMQAGTQYSVSVAQGGSPVSAVTPPSCTASDGNVTTGQIKLTFQQAK
jgi:hypothetical protein